MVVSELMGSAWANPNPPIFPPVSQPPFPAAPGAEPLRQFYVDRAGPFLRGEGGAELVRRATSDGLFRSLREEVPDPVRPAVDGLESLCGQRRSLVRRRRLLRGIGAALLAYVPLGCALSVLGAAMTAVSLRYR